MYNAEKIMKEIKDTLSLEVSYMQIKYNINEKGETVCPSTVDAKLYGNPSDFKDEEYEKLKELCIKKNIDCMAFESQETKLHHDFFGDGELLSADFMDIENYESEYKDFEIYSIDLEEVIYEGNLYKRITDYKLKDEKYKELLKERIKELMSLGYENETDLKNER